MTPASLDHCSRSERIRARAVIAFALFAWVGAVVAGFAAALVHEQTPAERHTVVASWPLDTICQPPALKPMLVLFIHPKCPCLRASIEEIANLRKVCGVGFDLQCVFLQPDAATWHSEETANWRDAQTLAPCQMIVDRTGEEHRRFGATTSGEVFLFSAGGELQFHGGVTIGRGHSGQSAGRLAIEAIVNNSSPRLCEAPVYGCPLESPCQAAASCGRNEAKLQR